jgi:hypothetical protein
MDRAEKRCIATAKMACRHAIHALMLLIMSLFLLAVSFHSASAQDSSNEEVTVPSSNFSAVHLRVLPPKIKKVSKDDVDLFLQEWKLACEQLGMRLTTGKGPFGMGLFDKHVCEQSGDESKSLENTWEIVIEEQAKVVLLQVYWHRGGESEEEKAPVAKIEIPQSGYMPQLLQDADFADIVALQVLTELPFSYRLPPGKASSLKGKDFSKNRWVEKLKETAMVLSRPTAIRFFAYKNPPGQTLLTIEVLGRSKANVSKGKVQYKIPKSVQRNEEPIRVAHDAKGRSTYSAAIGSSIEAWMKEAIKDLELDKESLFASTLTGLEDTFAKGYFGFRWGKQTLIGIPVLEQTSMIGILGEIRGGPLSGLRVYHDRVLEVEADHIVEGINYGKTSLRWSRTLLGYSFAFDFPWVIDQIDITPKIGLWDFAATFPIALSSGEVVPREFLVDNEPSFALEVGVEWIASEYSIRPWFSADVALVTSQLSSSGVSSQRWGVDGWWSGGPDFDLYGATMKTAFLGFAVFEDIELVGKGGAEEDSGTFINSIDYRAAYLGVGVAVSW